MYVHTDGIETVAPSVKKGGMSSLIVLVHGVDCFGQHNLYAYHTVKQVGRLNDSTNTQAYAECRDCKQEYSRVFDFENHHFRNVTVEYTSGIICL